MGDKMNPLARTTDPDTSHDATAKKKKFSIGQRFDYFTITGEPVKNRSLHTCFPVLCDCGAKKLIRKDWFGRVRSCGCKKSKLIGDGHRTHGKRQSPEYTAWAGMKERCSGKKNRWRKNYYERGISVCALWDLSFESFFAYMGEKPSKNHSLDRINNNGNYEPGNCRWATAAQQTRNSRSTKLNEEKVENIRIMRLNGISYKDIGSKYGISDVTASRIARGISWRVL
jgi:hypothetical protein